MGANTGQHLAKANSVNRTPLSSVIFVVPSQDTLEGLYEIEKGLFQPMDSSDTMLGVDPGQPLYGCFFFFFLARKRCSQMSQRL